MIHDVCCAGTLVTILDFDAAKEASWVNVKVRTVVGEENEIDRRETQVVKPNKITGLLSKGKQVNRCWNCGEQGHYRRNCKRPLFILKRPRSRKTKRDRPEWGTVDQSSI